MRYFILIIVVLGYYTVQAQRIKAWHEKSEWDKITAFQFKTDSLTAEEALWVADALFRNRQVDEAERVLIRIQKQKNYKTHQLYWQLTQIYMVQGKWIVALESIENALKTQPNNRVYLDTRAGILFKLERYALAQTEYQRLFKSKSTDFKSFMMTYQCMAQQENYRAAYQFLQNNKRLFSTNKQKTQIAEELIKTQLYHYKNIDSAYAQVQWAEKNNLVSEKILIYNMIIYNQLGNEAQANKNFKTYQNHWNEKKLSSNAQNKNTVLFDEFINSGIGFQVFRRINESHKMSIFLQDIKGMYIVGKIEIKIESGKMHLIGKSNYDTLEKSEINLNNYYKNRKLMIDFAKELMKTEEE